MENKTNYTDREIIVSKFEIYPFEPSECEYSGFPKGVCQLEINTRDKEVTLKVISGSAPSLQLAALVIRSNKQYSGHIIMTHERFLCMNRNAELLNNHRVIIDEDILRSVYSAVIVDNYDIRNALKENIFSIKTTERMNSI